MGVRWAERADKHGIAHEDSLYAILNAVHVVPGFDESRVPGEPAPTLYIGQAGRGGALIEVLAAMTEPRDVFGFHSMPLRQLTVERAGFRPEED